MRSGFVICVLATLLPWLLVTEAADQPNIIFILADDLGWDDVSFHGSKQIPTPNIDTLAYDGIILNNYYIQPICTPSRSALMTGKHPIHTGLQHSVILVAEPYGVSLEEKLMPEYFKEIGYSTHMVGKWHLGTCSWDYTPTFRGFDSHYGYLNGKEDYWDHTNGNHGWHLGYFDPQYVPTNRGFDTHYGYYQGCGDYWDHTYTNGDLTRVQWGLDFWNNTKVVKTAYGQYSTELFTTQAEKIINEHDTSKPLFMYLPHQAVHSGNPITPLEAPWKYLKNFDYISDDQRRKFAGMMSALDDSVGNITKALSARGMLNNTVIAFSTDNGGPAAGFDMNMACNWPLRGVKLYNWEGGVRGAGFLWSPLLKKSGYVSEHMMQIFDWLPTLLSVSGYNMTKLPQSLDGMDMWHTLKTNQAHGPRKMMNHNVDDRQPSYAVRVDDWKIIWGPSAMDGWYAPGQKPRVEDVLQLRKESPEVKGTEEMLKAAITEAEIGQEHYLKMRETEIAPSEMFHSDLVDILTSIGRDVPDPHPVVIDCGPKPDNATTNCNVSIAPCVYNIKEDPCEYNNLALSMPDKVAELLEIVAYFNQTAVKPRNKGPDPQGYPIYHGGIWAPWINVTADNEENYVKLQPAHHVDY